jgi:hypothetical protein
VENQTTGVVLNQTGPLNAPFLENDESCAAGGLSQLPPNTSLFVGASLGAPDLAGQTIRFEMHLCTQDNLAGECHNLPIIFVVP